MIKTHNPIRNSIEEGILKVGIGKYGSEPIEDSLADPIIQELESPDIPSIQKGALIGALFLKGFESKGEKKIQNHFHLYTPKDIIQKFCLFAPHSILQLIEKMLNYQTLNREESYQIGKYLMNPEIKQEQEFEIGLITTIFRFRYETIEEYSGLLQAIQELFFHPWNQSLNIDHRTIIITEPFDGVERSYLLTPIIGSIFLSKNYIPVFIVSDNPGPKNHYNLKDLAKDWKEFFVSSAEEFNLQCSKIQFLKENPLFHGFYIDISNLSSILVRWIHRRKLLKKRPFLATLERIYNPINAKYQLFSAFHPPYLEKTTEILEAISIPNIAGIRRGEEGGLTFSFNKRNEVLISHQNQNNLYQRSNQIFFLSYPDPIRFLPDLQINRKIIVNYLKNQNLHSLKELNQEQTHYIQKQIDKTKEMYQYIISVLENTDYKN